MRRTLLDILILGILAVIAVLIAIFLALPSMNWSAIRKPGQMENRLAGYLTSNWIRRNADTQPNKLPPTPENLKAGQSDFEEHCAGCHGLEGDGENRFEADFYPPVPKLNQRHPKIVRRRAVFHNRERHFYDWHARIWKEP